MKRWHWLALVVVLLGGVAVAQYGGSPGGTDNPLFTSVWVTGAPGVFPGSGCTTYPGGGRVCGDNKGGVTISALDGGTPSFVPPIGPSGPPDGGWGPGALADVSNPIYCLSGQSDGGCLSWLTAYPPSLGAAQGSPEICGWSNGIVGSQDPSCVFFDMTNSGTDIKGAGYQGINDIDAANYCDPTGVGACLNAAASEFILEGITANAPWADYKGTSSLTLYDQMLIQSYPDSGYGGTAMVQMGGVPGNAPRYWGVFTGQTAVPSISNYSWLLDNQTGTEFFNVPSGQALYLGTGDNTQVALTNGALTNTNQTITVGTETADAGSFATASIASSQANFIATVSGLDGGAPPSTPMYCEIGEVTFTTATSVSTNFQRTFTHAPLCVCSLGTETSGTVGPQKCASSTTQFTLTEAASSTGQVNYICCGQ